MASTTAPSASAKPTKTKPAWVPDTASSKCLLCNSTFTLFFRRHHCRRCGILCCETCSLNKMRLAVYYACGDQPVRVCKICYTRKSVDESLLAIPSNAAIEEAKIKDAGDIGSPISEDSSDVIFSSNSVSPQAQREVSFATTNKIAKENRAVKETVQENPTIAIASPPNVVKQIVQMHSGAVKQTTSPRESPVNRNSTSTSKKVSDPRGPSMDESSSDRQSLSTKQVARFSDPRVSSVEEGSSNRPSVAPKANPKFTEVSTIDENQSSSFKSARSSLAAAAEENKDFVDPEVVVKSDAFDDSAKFASISFAEDPSKVASPSSSNRFVLNKRHSTMNTRKSILKNYHSRSASLGRKSVRFGSSPEKYTQTRFNEVDEIFKKIQEQAKVEENKKDAEDDLVITKEAVKIEEPEEDDVIIDDDIPDVIIKTEDTEQDGGANLNISTAEMKFLNSNKKRSGTRTPEEEEEIDQLNQTRDKEYLNKMTMMIQDVLSASQKISLPPINSKSEVSRASAAISISAAPTASATPTGSIITSGESMIEDQDGAGSDSDEE